MRSASLVALAVLLAGGPANALTLDCLLREAHSATLIRGKLQPTGAPNQEAFRITFSDINQPQGVARVVGNQGSSSVIAISTDAKWTFIEVTEAKNVMVTSVPIPSSKDELVHAVHDRHSWLLSKALLSRYVGQCAVR